MSGRDDPQQRFVNALQQLVEREDRGTLAALRRGLGKEPGTVAEMHPFVLRWMPSTTTAWQERDWYLVASLFAIHQRNWPPAADGRAANFGTSFAQLGQKTDSGSVERRFVALLNADREDMPQHLRHAVSLLGSHDIRVNFAELLRDLGRWDHDSRWIQRKWARSFWGNAPRTEDADVEPAASTTE